MKKFITLLIGLLLYTINFAQTDGISYQAVIIDPNVQELPGNNASGNILPNAAVSLQFTILNDTGNIDYQEVQTTTTDTFGLINVFIGEGTPQSGNFNEIDWDGTPKNLKVAIDFTGGANFETLSEQKLTFVPYAFHRNITATGNMTIAGTSEFNGDGVFNENVSVFGNTLLEQNLDVMGNVVVDGTSELRSNTVVGQSLSVDGETSLNGALSVTNASPTNLSGNLSVEGTTTLANEVQVNGATTFNDAVTVAGANPTRLGGTLTVEGITTLNNDFIINGQTIMNNGLLIQGNTELNGSLTVSEVTNLQENLNVAGVASIANGLVVSSESPSLLSGTLQVNGGALLDDTVQITGETLIENNAVITNNTRVGENFSVGGTTNLGDTLNVNNQADTNLSGVLNVASVSNLNSDLNVQGITNLEDDLNVMNSGNSNLSGVLNVTGVSNLDNDLNVQGVTNLESEFSVNNAAASNLSGELNVTGITTLNNELNANGISNFNDDVNIEGELTSNSKIEATGLYISSDEGVEGDYVAVFENTSGSQSADGIAIRIETSAISAGNHFVSFYGDNDYLAGRIESYDLLGGDLWETFPVPNFETLLNVFDFTQVLEWTPPTFDFNTGSLPTSQFSAGTLPSASFSRGSLPSLSINFTALDFDFSRGSLPSLSFNSGSLPSLSFNSGMLPSASLDIGDLDLNFDGFFNPTAGAAAASQVGAMVAWGEANGNPGFLPTTPWKIALTPVIISAKQVAKNQGIVYGSKGADYAEWLAKENPEDNFMFGEVVGVKGGKISRNTNDADQVMTISYNPIVLGNMPEPGNEANYEKVGFMGQVPVLVAGKVAIGDFIVASGNNDGYAIAISPETIQLKDLKNIIGRAWSENKVHDLNMINVSVGLKTNEWIMIFEQQEKKINTIQKQLDEFNQVIKTVQSLQTKVKQLEIN